MAITLQDYLTSLQGKRVAVIGIGVSNTPLIKTLLQAGISVTACDKAPAQHSVPWLTSWSPWVQCFIWGMLSGWSRPGCHFPLSGNSSRYSTVSVRHGKGSALTSEMEFFFRLSS